MPSFASELRRVRKEIQRRVEQRAQELRKERAWLAKEDDREGNVEATFVSRMLDEKWMHIKADRLNTGWTDQIFFGRGPRTVIVEFKKNKSPSKSHAKLQEHFRSQFKELGYEVYCVRGWAEAMVLFKELTGRELRKDETTEVTT